MTNFFPGLYRVVVLFMRPLAGLVFASGCASVGPTPYLAEPGGSYGLSVSPMEAPFAASVFVGNAYTPVKWAYHYSRMGAVEFCRKSSAMAFMMKTVDSTKKRTRMDVSSSTQVIPSYVNVQGRLFRNFQGDRAYTNTYTYPVTLKYPNFGTLFACSQRFNSVQGVPRLKTLSRELVSPYTKDFRGGLLVDTMKNPAQLKKGDVVLAVEGNRVENLKQFLKTFTLAEFQKSFVTFRIIRQQKIRSLQVGVVDQSSELLLQNDREVDHGCHIFNKKSASLWKDTVAKVPLCSQAKAP